MAIDCLLNAEAKGSTGNIFAQQLFLGASIVNFSSNLGWGGSASSLNVDLVSDFGSLGDCNISQNPNLDVIRVRNSSYDSDNHYYNCVGNSCFIDERGFDYDPNRPLVSPDGPDVAQPSTRKVIPGKVYHYIAPNGDLVSRYWRKHDPGFFGAGTLISPDGKFTPRRDNSGNLLPYKYNIIGVPVMFRYGSFVFGGVVTSWDATINGVPIGTSSFDIFNTSISYRVTINSADSILDNAKVILNDYAGSIFCSLANRLGGPTNYTGPGGRFTGLLKDGNIPNVFNVYGFLESFGFGTSNKNDNGIPISYILDALSVLTSTSASLGAKYAFSPFGRILAPIPLTDAINPQDEYFGQPTRANFGNYSFGMLNQEIDNTGTPRIRLALDLSEIPRPPIDIRIGEGSPVMSLKDLIRLACEKTNRDFFTTIVCKNGINFIKIKTINRGIAVPVNSIEATIKTITDANLPVTQSSFGQTDNQVSPRVMLIGANQKRLYQAKSFLLGYSNAQLVYHPVLRQFIDYYRFGKTTTDSIDNNNNQDKDTDKESEEKDDKGDGKEDGKQPDKAKDNDKKDKIKLSITKDKKFVDTVRIPLAYSTRNIEICSLINGSIVTEIWSNEQDLANKFYNQDLGFSDIPIGGKIVPIIGNYNPSAIYKMKAITDAPKSTKQSSKNSSEKDKEPEETDTEDKEPVQEKNKDSTKSDAPKASNPRYLPLYKYVISPFFGFVNDFALPNGVGPYANRFVRPVYFDTVTGQIIVLCRGNELPVLTFGKLFPLFAKRPTAVDTLGGQLPDLEGAKEGSSAPANGETGESDSDAPVPPTPPPVSGTQSPKGRDPLKIDKLKELLQSPSFGVTESEMRASENLDSYLAYCLSKLSFSKPDLFVMLVRAYLLNGKGIVKPISEVQIDTITNFANVQLGASGPESAGGANAGDASLGAGKTTGNLDTGFPDVLNVNFAYTINYEFYNDLERLRLFIKKLHDEYYGKKYAVSLPSVAVYRDKQFADVQIPAGADTIGVYQGSGKLFYSYEISSEGAWEEFGNTINDNMVVGGPNYYTFLNDGDESNLIQPIIGYNATPIKDYTTEAWCNLNTDQRDKELAKAYKFAAPDKLKKSAWNSKKGCAFIRRSFELSSLARYFMCDKSITASLDLSSLNDDPYLLLYTGDAGREDAYGKRLIGGIKDPCDLSPEITTIRSQKLYIKTSVDKQIVFYDPLNLALPKAIISSPGIDLALSSSSFREDPNRTVLSTVAAEDLAIITYFEKYGAPKNFKKMIADLAEKINLDPTFTPSEEAKKELITFGVLDETCEEDDVACFDTYEKLASALNGKSGEDAQHEARVRILKYLLHKQIIPLTASKFLIPAPNSSAQSITHYMLAPKKANPVFAAVPLTDNISCYGPWTNYPVLDNPSYAFPGISNINDLTEQLIADTRIDKQDDWAPWNYGGMALLDRKMLYEIEASTSYQTRRESGEFSIAGLPVFSMGSNLVLNKTDQDILQRVVKTWFDFPYHSLEFVSAYNSFNFNNYSGLTLSDVRLSIGGGSVSTTYSFQTYSAKRGIYNKENSDRLKHASLNVFSVAKKIAEARQTIEASLRKQILAIDSERRKGGTDTDASAYSSKLYGTSPSVFIVGKARHYWPLGNYSKNVPKNKEDNTKKTIDDLRWEKSRFDSWAGFFETREALNEMTFNYNSQAGMSFDGLYSPVSFYPTIKHGTYPISSRCITENDKKREIICPGCANEFVIKIGDGDDAASFPCPLCQRSKVLAPATIKETTANNTESEPPIINFLSLNPIIMPTGDFVNPNSQPKQYGERNRHNISFILRDETHIVDRSIMLHHNLTKYDDTSGDPHPDWSDIDVSFKEDNGTNILNNHRFFAHRGPLMLHGWGYDTEGYPVPNSADEPLQIDDDGRPKRFFLTPSGTNDLSSDGAFIPTKEKPLGDIIGKGWAKEDGKWIRKPSSKFLLNWGERPDLWPIGPVDLRWDYERKVWTGGGGGGGCDDLNPPYILASGNSSQILASFILASQKKDKNCSYKMIYGVLEQDLVKLENSLETFPARAFLDDLEYGLKPLPENIRRLIYIVDRTGYTAPRGAKILLRYNTDTGFYEPVSKQQYLVYGILNGNNTASVEFSFMPGYKSGDFAYKFNINYLNPLNIGSLARTSNNRRGLFMYDNSKWNLIAIG